MVGISSSTKEGPQTIEPYDSTNVTIRSYYNGGGCINDPIDITNATTTTTFTHHLWNHPILWNHPHHHDDGGFHYYHHYHHHGMDDTTQPPSTTKNTSNQTTKKNLFHIEIK